MSGRGLRAYKVTGPCWNKCEFAAAWRKLELPSGCCDVTVRTASVWAATVDYKQRWTTHWALIPSDIQSDPEHYGTSGGVWRLHYHTTTFITLFVMSVLFFLCYSRQPFAAWIKKASYNYSSQMTWKEDRSSTNACFWPFCDMFLAHFVCFRLAACLRQRNSALKVLPSHWLWQPFPGLFLLPGGDPNTLLYHHVELRAHG